MQRIYLDEATDDDIGRIMFERADEYMKKALRLRAAANVLTSERPELSDETIEWDRAVDDSTEPKEEEDDEETKGEIAIQGWVDRSKNRLVVPPQSEKQPDPDPAPEPEPEKTTKPEDGNGETSEPSLKDYKLDPGQRLVFDFIAAGPKDTAAVRKMLGQQGYAETSAYPCLGRLKKNGLINNNEKGSPYSLTALGRQLHSKSTTATSAPQQTNAEHLVLKALSTGRANRSDLGHFLVAEGYKENTVNSAVSRLKIKKLVENLPGQRGIYRLTALGQEKAQQIA